jgi:hypothetical protein
MSALPISINSPLPFIEAAEKRKWHHDLRHHDLGHHHNGRHHSHCHLGKRYRGAANYDDRG